MHQSRSKSETAAVKSPARRISFHWPIFFIIIYACLFLLVISGYFNTCRCDVPAQDSQVPARKETLSVASYLSGNTIIPEKSIGYIPYKPGSVGSARGVDGSTDFTHILKRQPLISKQRGGKTKEEGSGDSKGTAEMPTCPQGKKSCEGLGHPEICCDESHTCLPTNNTLTGTYCCRSSDPVNMPCNDSELECDEGWYECPATANGGCCKYGQRCGILQCYEGGGPTGPSPTSPLPNTLLPDPDMDGDGILGSQDNTPALRTTITYSGTRRIMTTTWGSNASAQSSSTVGSLPSAGASTSPGTIPTLGPFTEITTTTSIAGPAEGTSVSGTGKKLDLVYGVWSGVAMVGFALALSKVFAGGL